MVEIWIVCGRVVDGVADSTELSGLLYRVIVRRRTAVVWGGGAIISL